ASMNRVFLQSSRYGVQSETLLAADSYVKNAAMYWFGKYALRYAVWYATIAYPQLCDLLNPYPANFRMCSKRPSACARLSPFSTDPAMNLGRSLSILSCFFLLIALI